MTMMSLIAVLKIIVLASVLFVWVVRYDNIISEFKQYNLPDWLRDLVGILKISFVIMLLNNESTIVLFGSAGIVILMLAALVTHLRIKNPIKNMLPAFTLMILSLTIFLTTF
jgi:hypothetical protein